MEYQRDEHHVHLIVYHLVWCPKRRRAILKGAVGKLCRAMIEHKCAEQGWTILELAIQPDHVHLFVRVGPSDAASEVVRQVKGLSSHEMRIRFPQLLRMPSVWTRSYFASTAGNVSAEAIQRYIEAQSRQ